jgi:MFS family permease
MKGNEVFRIRAFTAFLFGRFSLTLAVQIQALSVSLLVYERSRDALSLGIIGLAEAIPFMVFILPGGFWADVFPRKRMILFSTALFGMCAGILFYFSVHPEEIELIQLYGLIGLTGIARATGGPSMQAILPNLLKHEFLPQGIAWNTGFWQIASVMGPALGGLIYGYMGTRYAFATAMALTFIAFLLFSSITLSEKKAKRSETLFESLRSGISFVGNHRILLPALSLDLFAVLFGGAVALLPLFNSQILHAGPEGLGWLRAAPSVGAIVTAIILARRPPVRQTGRKLFISVALFGACMIAFALSESYWLSFFLLVFSGAFDAVSVLIRSMLVQLFTPDEMRGRVSSVNSIFIGSSNEIGAFESGLAARILGLVPSVVFGGCMTLIVAGTIAMRAKKLRKLQLDKA